MTLYGTVPHDTVKLLVMDIAEELGRHTEFTVNSKKAEWLGADGWGIQFLTHYHNRGMGILMTLPHWLSITNHDPLSGMKWRLLISSGVVFEADTFEKLRLQIQKGMNVIVGICDSLKKGAEKAVPELKE